MTKRERNTKKLDELNIKYSALQLRMVNKRYEVEIQVERLKKMRTKLIRYYEIEEDYSNKENNEI